MTDGRTPYFPVFVNIEQKRIVVFGAGKIAVRRIRTLQFFHAQITVIAREIPEESREEMEDWIRGEKIRFRQKIFTPEDLEEGIFLVLAATDEPETNTRICSHCRALKILANNASNREDCDFYFPAVAYADHIVAGISGDGTDHARTAHAAEGIRKYLENEYGTEH